jgi:DNA-binding ferritin-like protein
MIEVFSEMTHMARNTGIEMSTLVGIAEQFDTFESAAQSVGRLNAVFGGPYLNTLDMMNKTADEQVEALHAVFRQTGMNFDQLEKHEKMLIANTTGFKSLADASKFFNSSLAELTKRNKELEETEKRVQAAQSVMEKLNKISQTFAITIGPLVDLVGELADQLLALEEKTRFTIAGFDMGAVSIATFAIAAFKLLPGLGGLVTGFVSMAPAMGGVAAAGQPAAAAIGAIGKAGTKSAVGLLVIGASALMAGVGLGVAAFGASKLVEALSLLSVEQLTGIIGALLATSLLAPAAPFLALAAVSITALAGAYYLLAQAIDQIDLEKLNSITNFNNSVVSLAETGAESVQTVKQVVEIIRDTVQKAEEAGGTDTIQKIKEMIEVILGTTGGGTAASSPAATNAGGVATHKIELDFMLGDRSIKKMVYSLIDNKFEIGGDNIA